MQRLKFNSQLYVDNVLGICPECKEEAFSYDQALDTDS